MRNMTLAALALALVAGCLVVVDDNRHRPPPPPAHATAVVYASSWHDTRYVVWREYYDCDDYDIYYCESLHGYDEDDLLALLFISRLVRIPIRLVVFEYDRHRRDLFSVALFYRMTGDEFFHPAVQRGYCPPPYGNAYGYYWNRQRGYRLNNEEVRALVHLRIGVEYYGYKPHDYFREHDRYRAQGHAHGFREIAVRDYKQAGSGGKNIHQAAAKKAERPWEAQNRVEWERRRDESREKAKAREAAEPPRHPEAEKARRQFEEAEKGRKEEVMRKAREDEENRKRAGDDAQRRKAEEDRKKAAEDAQRRKAEEDRKKAVEDAQRRKAEEDRKKAVEDAQRRKVEEDRKRADEAERRAAEERRKKQEEQKKEEEKKKQEEKKKDEKKDEKKKDRRP